MDFKKLVGEYKDFMMDDPFTATDSGVHTKDLQVSDLSRKKIMSDLKIARQLLKKTKTIKIGKDDIETSTDLDMMKLNLKKTIFHTTLKYNGLYDWEQKPQLGSTLMNGFMYLFLKDPRPAKKRLDAINSRFEKAPAMILQYHKVVKQPIKRWKDMEVEELEGIPDLFNNIITWAEKEKYAKTDELKKNVEKTHAAIKEYIAFLNKLPRKDDFDIGPKRAQELAHLNGIDYSLEEIYNIAKKFFEEHQRTIDGISSRLKIKYNLGKNLEEKEVLSFIKEKYSIPIDKVVDTYKSEQKRIFGFLKKTDLFILPKSDKLIILQTPKYLVPSIPVGAMFPPAPFEKGPKVSLVYLTIDKGRQKDQNSLMITNTMIHEGIPGHHMQFSIAYENKSVVRKLSSYNTHAEGWTTYLEGFMATTDLIDGKIKDEYLLIALSDFARLGARVAIDLYFMTGEERYLQVISGFTPSGKTRFDKAKSLLTKATGFTDARAEGELNWYSKSRGYPMCYLLGNMMVKSLKAEIVEKVGDEIKGSKIFHKIFLKEGVMPLPFLKRIVDRKLKIKR